MGVHVAGIPCLYHIVHCMLTSCKYTTCRMFGGCLWFGNVHFVIAAFGFKITGGCNSIWSFENCKGDTTHSLIEIILHLWLQCNQYF